VLHLDLYRLTNPREVWELGWRELGEADDVVLIEWPERAEGLLPADRWDIYLELADDVTLRRVRAVAAGHPPPLPAPEGG
jgi:tRNA A37 threonylcarbamoyladenosine biosynthesis protein TsaE